MTGRWEVLRATAEGLRQPRGRLEASAATYAAISTHIVLTGAPAGAVALEVSLHLSNSADKSLVPLRGSATSIKNMFAPYDRRDRESDHKNQGESDGDEDGLLTVPLDDDHG
jgi:hypothetical protein